MIDLQTTPEISSTDNEFFTFGRVLEYLSSGPKKVLVSFGAENGYPNPKENTNEITISESVQISLKYQLGSYFYFMEKFDQDSTIKLLKNGELNEDLKNLLSHEDLLQEHRIIFHLVEKRGDKFLHKVFIFKKNAKNYLLTEIEAVEIPPNLLTHDFMENETFQLYMQIFTHQAPFLLSDANYFFIPPAADKKEKILKNPSMRPLHRLDISITTIYKYFLKTIFFLKDKFNLNINEYLLNNLYLKYHFLEFSGDENQNILPILFFNWSSLSEGGGQENPLVINYFNWNTTNPLQYTTYSLKLHDKNKLTPLFQFIPEVKISNFEINQGLHAIRKASLNASSNVDIFLMDTYLVLSEDENHLEEYEKLNQIFLETHKKRWEKIVNRISNFSWVTPLVKYNMAVQYVTKYMIFLTAPIEIYRFFETEQSEARDVDAELRKFFLILESNNIDFYQFFNVPAYTKKIKSFSKIKAELKYYQISGRTITHRGSFVNHHPESHFIERYFQYNEALNIHNSFITKNFTLNFKPLTITKRRGWYNPSCRHKIILIDDTGTKTVGKKYMPKIADLMAKTCHTASSILTIKPDNKFTLTILQHLLKERPFVFYLTEFNEYIDELKNEEKERKSKKSNQLNPETTYISFFDKTSGRDKTNHKFPSISKTIKFFEENKDRIVYADFLITKEKIIISNQELVFTKFKSSTDFDLDFWSKMFDEVYGFHFILLSKKEKNKLAKFNIDLISFDEFIETRLTDVPPETFWRKFQFVENSNSWDNMKIFYQILFKTFISTNTKFLGGNLSVPVRDIPQEFKYKFDDLFFKYFYGNLNQDLKNIFNYLIKEYMTIENHRRSFFTFRADFERYNLLIYENFSETEKKALSYFMNNRIFAFDENELNNFINYFMPSGLSTSAKNFYEIKIEQYLDEIGRLLKFKHDLNLDKEVVEEQANQIFESYAKKLSFMSEILNRYKT